MMCGIKDVGKLAKCNELLVSDGKRRGTGLWVLEGSNEVTCGVQGGIGG
jgi:hypothetical protein